MTDRGGDELRLSGGDGAGEDFGAIRVKPVDRDGLTVAVDDLELGADVGSGPRECGQQRQKGQGRSGSHTGRERAQMSSR